VITPAKQKTQGEISVSLDIKNTGNRKGDKVVQLYVKDKVSSVITYDSQLRGFELVSLLAGETKKVTFTLKPADLELKDKDMHWVVEPRDFEVLVVRSLEDI